MDPDTPACPETESLPSWDCLNCDVSPDALLYSLLPLRHLMALWNLIRAGTMNSFCFLHLSKNPESAMASKFPTPLLGDSRNSIQDDSHSDPRYLSLANSTHVVIVTQQSFAIGFIQDDIVRYLVIVTQRSFAIGFIQDDIVVTQYSEYYGRCSSWSTPSYN
ncbi:hypothetical protein ACER0C_018687 [Sarotherodon galilaeus]